MRLRTVLQSARPAFLPLAHVCVLLGIAVVAHAGEPFSGLFAAWVALGAVAAHVSVNALNEYRDYESGLDLRTQRTPFSGGSGALPADPAAHRAVGGLAAASLGLTALVGLTIVFRHGPAILPLGLAGIGLVLTYTQGLNRRPWLCLVAPGLGFGLFMVPATQFALTGDYRLDALLLAVVPFLLVNNLLLLNQYPDIEADATVGRRHVPIAYGVRTANAVYGAQWLAAGAAIVAFGATGRIPPAGLLALVPWAAGGIALRGAVVHGLSIGRRPAFLAANVVATLLTPLALAIALLFG
jgi:1,4-dihydroxy-2-naphthoate octaprenyltransferase